jgi:hypothetical protein
MQAIQYAQVVAKLAPMETEDIRTALSEIKFPYLIGQIKCILDAKSRLGLFQAIERFGSESLCYSILSDGEFSGNLLSKVSE